MDSALRRAQESVTSNVEPIADVDERALLSRIAARDLEAMRDFYLLYQRRLVRFLSRITTRHELIDEIVNEALLIVWQKAGQFRGGSRVSTWVMGIAWRHGLTSVRRERRLAAYPVLPEVPPALEADCLESRDALERAMSMLPLEQRVAVELAYVGGYSCEEIGAIMTCPANTVKTRLFHARRRLRLDLDASGPSVAGLSSAADL
jgi:RNA polymerase sigma-70 factor (ECF subfamily)